MNKFIKWGMVTGAFLLLPFFVSAQTATMSTSELQALVQKLMEQVKALQTQNATLSGSNQSANSNNCVAFTATLRAGSNGKSVSWLHEVLTKEGFSIDSEEKTSSTYEESTASAVTGFQEKYKGEVLTPSGLKFGTGIVGAGTRAKLNKLYPCSTSSSSTTTNSNTSSTTVTPSTSQNLTITNAAILPKARINSTYQVNLAVSGGPSGVVTAHYLWSIESGQLPTGLYLRENGNDMVISGTPSVTVADRKFVVMVKYGDKVGRKEFTISVEAGDATNTTTTQTQPTTTSNTQTTVALSPDIFEISPNPINLNVNDMSRLKAIFTTGCPTSGNIVCRPAPTEVSPTWSIANESIARLAIATPRCVVGQECPKPTTDIVGVAPGATILKATYQNFRGVTMSAVAQVTVKGDSNGEVVPTIKSISLPMGFTGSNYTGSFNFTGDISKATSYSLASGELPPGLTLQKTASCSPSCIGVTGTPTRAGTYKFSLRLDIGGSGIVSTEQTLIIAETFSPLSITSDFNLPKTKAGENWSTTIQATGGSQSYSWSVSSGIIPPGTEIIQIACRSEGPCKTSFTLSGVPTTPGYYVFTVTVQSGTQIAVKMFNITVYEDTPPRDAPAVATSGYLDAANCDIFGGWAKDGDNPNTAIQVQVWSKVENLYWKKIGDYDANINRADVGQHAFSFFTPSSLKDGKNHYVYVYARNVGGEYTKLNPTGVKVSCGSVSKANSTNLDQIANSLEAIKSLFNSLFR
ncbi:MAG: hypothetical protein V4690_02510 [Patescibacteria group bacterium]